MGLSLYSSSETLFQHHTIPSRRSHGYILLQFKVFCSICDQHPEIPGRNTGLSQLDKGELASSPPRVFLHLHWSTPHFFTQSMAHPSLSLGRVLLYPHGYFFNSLTLPRTLLGISTLWSCPYLSALPGFSIFWFAFMPWPLEFQAVTSSSLQPPLNHNLQTSHKSSHWGTLSCWILRVWKQKINPKDKQIT